MRTSRRNLLIGTGLSWLWSTAAHAALPEGAITPESFGARGDGVTNDTDAFAAMAEFVNARGGGEIVLRKTTYIVGKQIQAVGTGASYSFAPVKIMEFAGCHRDLIIRGNGARLKCESGLRYGTFHPVTGRPTRNVMPYLGSGELASPYRSMIRVERSSGLIQISDLDLDGNVAGLQVGGQYGDLGWQIPAVGIQLVDNTGIERLSRIYSHHHALDGILIDGPTDRIASSTIESVICGYNGRQGCSVVGGSNYAFNNCRFNHTGKTVLASPPGAGVDVEAEGGKKVRNLHFSDCEFSNNTGVGMVADSGDSEVALFERCIFIGTTSWAVWPRKPRFKFVSCTFVGPIVHAFGDTDPARASRFHDCTFRDDPALTPTGSLYGGENPSRPIADLPGNPNVLFDRCRFLLTHEAVLPWTTNVVIFANCLLSQRAPAQAYPRGTFVGKNVIIGNVDLYASKVRGELIVNGKTVTPH